MKKFIILLLCIMMILSFTACENGTQPATPPKTYVITLNLDGGSIDDDITTIEVVYGEQYDLGNPVKPDYQFNGWIYDGKPIATKGVWTIEKDITVVATWEVLRTYFITLDLDGGSIDGDITTIEVVYGRQYDLGKPTKPNYQFDGWVYNGKKIATKGVWNIEEDITVVATWDFWTPII